LCAALSALERLLSHPRISLRVAEILEPPYRDAGEVQKLIGIHEIQVSTAARAINA